MEDTEGDENVTPILLQQTELQHPVFQRWKTVEQLLQSFYEILNFEKMPPNFMEILSESLGVGRSTKRISDLQLWFYLRSRMTLNHFNEEEGRFLRSWSLSDVRAAVESLNMGKVVPLPNKNPPTPLARKSKPLFDILLPEELEKPKPLKSRSLLPEEIEIRQSWEPLLGKSIRKVGSKDFLKVTHIVEIPKMKSQSKLLAEILPYIIQKIKMGGAFSVQSKYLIDLVVENIKANSANINNNDQKTSTSRKAWTVTETSPTSITSSEGTLSLTDDLHTKIPISRLDLLVTILTVVDAALVQDIARLLGQFPVALPLIMPSIGANVIEPYTVTIPLLQNIVIKRATSREEILENHLFKSPFKLVAAVRLGNNSVGKSTILNQLMEGPYMFSSVQEPGADRGKPLSLHGSVEFTWLTVENCKKDDVLWDRLKNLYNDTSNEILLLANLHGNAIDHPDVIQTLKSLACAFLVFQMPGELSIMDSNFKTFEEMIQDSSAVYLMIDPFNQPLITVPEEVSIDTRNLKFSTLDKVATKLVECFQSPQQSNLPLTRLEDFGLGKDMKFSPRISIRESENIISLIDSLSCSEIKEKLKLQKHSVTDLDHYEKVWRNDETLQKLIQMLVKMLDLPLRQRQIAFAHLDREISMRSGEDSRQTRLLLCRLKEERFNLASRSGIPSEDKKPNKSLAELDQQLSDVSEQLERNNLGLEHFFREIGRIYEIALHNPEDKFSSDVFRLAPQLAELFLEGQVIELLDGDLGRLSTAWLNAISHEICKRKPGLKVFVVSILGLQSSGKSTLLNALFGCKFSVSSGRCTRGLFLRLLLLEESMKESTGIDAILLIDTEGLSAPEKMRDPDAEKRDRQMATFAMSISHLTIVNVMGESMKELADILQIVVVTLAKLETIEIAPDILLVQHGSEVDKGKFLSGASEFCKAIKEAIKVTDQQFTRLGIMNSLCLRTLCERVENHEILKLFHPYRSGATVNAPPSREYHEDVVDLYEKILKVMKTSTGLAAVEFHKWHTLLSSCWNAVAVQNFALRFKNIQEIHEFIDRGTRIANVNEAIEEALTYHRSLLKVYIRNQVFNSGNESKDVFVKRVGERIDTKLKQTLDSCESMTRRKPDSCSLGSSLGTEEWETYPCDKCLIANTGISELQRFVQGRAFEDEVLQTIDSHIQRVHEYTKEQLSEALMEQFQQKHLSEDVDKILHQLIQQHASNGNDYNISDGKTRSLMLDNILDKLAQKLACGKVNPLANLRDKMCQETVEVYKETPIADPKNRERLSMGQTSPDLRSVSAFPSDVSAKLSGMLQRGIINGLMRTRLDPKQACWLEDEVAALILKKQGADAYQIGMISKLQRDIDEILVQFTDRCGRLIETFKWEVHFYAIKEFYSYMEFKCCKEAAKNKINVLADKADVYRKKIDACLSHGFSYESEGRIIGECFLRALRQKAKKAGDEVRKQELLHQSWLANTENVRLHFFETLAAQIQNGDYVNSLEYFSNPKSSITSWFVNKVDSFEIQLVKSAAKDTFNTEVARIWKKIGTSKSCNEIKDFAMSYFAEVDGIQYSNELDFSKASVKNFNEFATSLRKTMKEKCQDHFNGIVYKACSQHKTVMDRLGCTEYCYWCGALCWGHVTHEQNKDSTRKHHSCHQPQGLIGVYDETTGTLLPTTCDSIQDDAVVRVKAGDSEDSKNGMTWKEIKRSKQFDNWVFINHSVDDFNNLMGWFFVKLNKEIATKAELLPCQEKDLKGLGLSHLDSKLDTIMTIIKQRLM